MRIWAFLLIGLLVAGGGGTARAKSTGSVAFLGVASSQLPGPELEPIAQSIDASLRRSAAAPMTREQTAAALRSSPAIARACRDAGAASRAGASALDRLELDRAASELERAVRLYRDCHGEWVDPELMAQTFILQARLAYTRRDTDQMYRAFVSALPLLSQKALDPAEFAPDAIRVFQRALADTTSVPPSPPDGDSFAGLARHIAAQWVVLAEAQRQQSTTIVTISLIDREATVRSTRARISAGDDPRTAVDDALTRLLHAAGVQPPLAVSRAGNTLVPTPTPLPNDDGRRAGGAPWYRRWYTVAAVGALVTGIAVAGTVAATRDSPGAQPTPTPTGTPGPSGVTVIIGVP